MSRTGMPSRTAAPAVMSAVLTVLLLTAGCSRISDTVGTSDPDDPAWTTSTDPVDTSGLIWATGSTVQLADGTTVDTGGLVTTYVVAGDGVYFTPADSAEQGIYHSNITTGPLHFADRDGKVTDTGLTVYVESLGSSPDGRYLGLIDATSGPKDRFSDQPQATAVVIDLTSGKRVVDTTDGMGNPWKDDLAHDYPEVYLSVRFLDTASAFVEGLGEDHLYSLPGGQGEPTDIGARDPLDRTSPDGAWEIADHRKVDVLVSANGKRVRPRTGTPGWELGWWLDDNTVLVFAGSGPGPGTDLGPDATSSLMACDVPTGECESVPGTEGQAVRFPVDTSPNDSVDLRGGETA